VRARGGRREGGEDGLDGPKEERKVVVDAYEEELQEQAEGLVRGEEAWGCGGGGGREGGREGERGRETESNWTEGRVRERGGSTAAGKRRKGSY
jgi:hypothetical protein